MCEDAGRHVRIEFAEARSAAQAVFNLQRQQEATNLELGGRFRIVRMGSPAKISE